MRNGAFSTTDNVPGEQQTHHLQKKPSGGSIVIWRGFSTCNSRGTVNAGKGHQILEDHLTQSKHLEEESVNLRPKKQSESCENHNGVKE